MRENHKDIARWIAEGSEVAVAQVTKAWGSSPRVPGSIMAISADGRVTGSVSGGCVEGNVIQAAMDCLKEGMGRMEKYHASNSRAQEVGLSCGGDIEILVSKLAPALFAIECAELNADREYLRVSLVEGPDPKAIGTGFLMLTHDTLAEGVENEVITMGVLNDASWYIVFPRASASLPGLLTDTFMKTAIEEYKRNKTKITWHVICDRYDFFFSKVMPKPKLICVGGVHIAIYLAQMAKMLGYRTAVIDPRAVFPTPERFPFVDDLIHAWPQEALKNLVFDSSTALCALAHDPKIDVPALTAALKSSAFYIGSLGRATTQLSRYHQLAEEGFGDDDIRRIFGPIGLDLRGKEPSEIALAIMAEITMVRSGGVLPTRTMLKSALLSEVKNNDYFKKVSS